MWNMSLPLDTYDNYDRSVFVKAFPAPWPLRSQQEAQWRRSFPFSGSSGDGCNTVQPHHSGFLKLDQRASNRKRKKI